MLYLCTMQHLRKIMILVFAFVIFTGTVGINVFKHFCSKDGLNYSYITPPSHSCQEAEEVEESCCHAEARISSSKHEIRKNCCEEEVSSYKISSDYIQKSATDLHLEFLPVKSVSSVFFEESYVLAETRTAGSIVRPPPKTGQEILILNQVFRI